MTRQDIASGQPIKTDVFSVAKKKVNKRGWDKSNNRYSRTYRGIPDSVHNQVAQIADKTGVGIGELVRKFLEYGIDAYNTGDLKLNAVPYSRKLTLYPDE